MAKLPPASKALYFSLLNKQKWFSKHKKLQEDGSFYYANEDLAAEMELDVKTIKRSKVRLIEAGLISVIPGKYRKHKTYYYIHKKGDKMPPFAASESGAKIPIKGDKLSDKGGQIVQSNIEINKERKNKESGSALAGFKSQAFPDVNEVESISRIPLANISQKYVDDEIQGRRSYQTDREIETALTGREGITKEMIDKAFEVLGPRLN